MKFKPWKIVSFICSFWLNVFILSTANAASDFSPFKDKPSGEAFVFYIENDTRSIGGPGSDNAYSNGVKFSYIFAENKMPDWAEKPVQVFDFLDPKKMPR